MHIYFVKYLWVFCNFVTISIKFILVNKKLVKENEPIHVNELKKPMKLIKKLMKEALNVYLLYVLTQSSEFLICCRALAISAAMEPWGPEDLLLFFWWNHRRHPMFPEESTKQVQVGSTQHVIKYKRKVGKRKIVLEERLEQ